MFSEDFPKEYIKFGSDKTENWPGSTYYTTSEYKDFFKSLQKKKFNELLETVLPQSESNLISMITSHFNMHHTASCREIKSRYDKHVYTATIFRSKLNDNGVLELSSDTTDILTEEYSKLGLEITSGISNFEMIGQNGLSFIKYTSGIPQEIDNEPYNEFSTIIAIDITQLLCNIDALRTLHNFLCEVVYDLQRLEPLKLENISQFNSSQIEIFTKINLAVECINKIFISNCVLCFENRNAYLDYTSMCPTEQDNYNFNYITFNPPAVYYKYELLEDFLEDSRSYNYLY